MITRADVERTVHAATLPAYMTSEITWPDVYAEHVSWLLSQIDRLETERRTLADLIAVEVTAPV